MYVYIYTYMYVYILRIAVVTDGDEGAYDASVSVTLLYFSCKMKQMPNRTNQNLAN